MPRFNHDETLKRENREEARYDVARTAALIHLALGDEMRSRLDTQVGSYQGECDSLRGDMRSMRGHLVNTQARLIAREADLKNYDHALNVANETIASLAKRSRLKASQIPHPVPTKVDYPAETAGEALTARPRDEERWHR